MKRKLLKFIPLGLGIPVVAAGTVLFIHGWNNNGAFLGEGILLYCLGFLLLGISFLLISKDTKEEKKRKALRFLSLYWLIFASIIMILLIILWDYMGL